MDMRGCYRVQRGLPPYAGQPAADPGLESLHEEQPCHVPSPRPCGPTLSRQGGEGASASERPCDNGHRSRTGNADTANDVGAAMSGPSCALVPSPLAGEGGPKGRVREPRRGKESCAQLCLTPEQYRTLVPLTRTVVGQAGKDTGGGGPQSSPASSRKSRQRLSGIGDPRRCAVPSARTRGGRIPARLVGRPRRRGTARGDVVPMRLFAVESADCTLSFVQMRLIKFIPCRR